MRSAEVEVRNEGPQGEEQANGTDGLPRSDPEASPVAELVEQSPIGAEDEKKVERKNLKRAKKNYVCRICQKQLSCGQALGGHMNGHTGVRIQEKMAAYEKFYAKYHQRSLPTPNLREQVPEASSFPIGNFNQPSSYTADNVTYLQTPQQMEPSQELYNSHPFTAGPEQFDWPQASTSTFDSNVAPTGWIPNMLNQSYMDNGTGNATYGSASYPSTDPSMPELTPQYSVDPNAQFSTYATYGSASYPSTDPSMPELTPQYSVDPNAQFSTSACVCPTWFPPL